MLFTLQFIQEQFPHYQGKLDEHIRINTMMTDSRQTAERALFVPIVGDRFDAHAFIDTAIENGAIAALWDKEKAIPADVPDSFVFYLVEDTTLALQQLAKAYLQVVQPIVIGVTGSNGKTTTKDLLTAVLSKQYRTSATIGNFNNHIGLPLTILQMQQDIEILVLEMGMSEFGEIELLTKLAEPTYAIITNIGESHIEYLGSRTGIAQAKLEICTGLPDDGFLIIDGDEPLLAGRHQMKNTITCGFQADNMYKIEEAQLVKDGTNFSLHDQSYHLSLYGKHHAQNAAFVIAVAEKLGLSKEQIQAGFESLAMSDMRFEWVEGKGNAALINDAYNASPTSMRASIDVLKQIEGYTKKIVVLGDVLELGPDSEALHRSVARAIDENITAIYTVGKDAAYITDEVLQRYPQITAQHFAEKAAVTQVLASLVDEQTVILFKGSRGMALEEIVQALEK